MNRRDTLASILEDHVYYAVRIPHVGRIVVVCSPGICGEKFNDTHEHAMHLVDLIHQANEAEIP